MSKNNNFGRRKRNSELLGDPAAKRQNPRRSPRQTTAALTEFSDQLARERANQPTTGHPRALNRAREDIAGYPTLGRNLERKNELTPCPIQKRTKTEPSEFTTKEKGMLTGSQPATAYPVLRLIGVAGLETKKPLAVA
jgi:hypothetical protein